MGHNSKLKWIAIIAIPFVLGIVTYSFFIAKPVQTDSTTPETLGYHRLTDISKFSEGQPQEAIRGITAELEKRNEDPKQFYAKFEPDPTASKLTFSLMHEDSFKPENLNTKGNASGKDRTAIYDLVTEEVSFLMWQ